MQAQRPAHELLATSLALFLPMGEQVDADHESNLRSARPQATISAGASADRLFGTDLAAKAHAGKGIGDVRIHLGTPDTVSASPGSTAQPPASTM
jgi:hypothetical protein